VQLATIRELARYWATDYDWRACEVRLNARPQFTTEIDGVRIHFIHVRSRHENALPLIMTYFLVEAGYPGLAYFNEVDKGGHFAAWEEPICSPARSAQRSGRSASQGARVSTHGVAWLPDHALKVVRGT
jgi:hypothetical protein